MSFKKCSVMLLPTNEKASNSILNLDNDNELLPIYRYEPKLEYGNQHLYILSDEQIKEGDWVLGDFPDNPIGKVISKYGEEFTAQALNKDKYGLAQYDSKKVIATTDSSLTKIVSDFDFMSGEAGEITIPALPQPSKQFIEEYVEEYNKGNIITKVMVEYYRRGKNSNGVDSDLTGGVIIHKDDYYVPKINTKDNTITIRKVKDSWSREEVITLMQFALNMGFDLNSNPLPRLNNISGKEYLNKWIEENL